MARTAHTPVIHETPEIAPEAYAEDAQALTTLSIADQQQNARVRAVALRVGYQLPGDAIDPDLIQRDIAANMRRSVEACLEVGRGLSVLKEACPHGQFLARLDVIGLDRKVAAKFMQAATKFSNVSSTRHLEAAIGSQTKLFEMLVLDDEQIDELALEGQTGELKLDDVATMSVKELRAKLRELRQKDEATQRLLQDKNAKIDELTTVKLGVSPWDEKVGKFKGAIAAHFDQLDQGVAQINLFHGSILDEDTQWGDDAEQERLILRQFAVLFGDRLKRLTQQFAELRDHYEATLAGWAAELDNRNLDLFEAAQIEGDAEAVVEEA
ncbi:hypothetical protein [Thauera humireducens]|uniref:Uncharacterized protein n=1 Tax=Thauera humireducens TaxID=1134435 RepID=A0A127K420_9RHOO|nr:hypothetical protein [Thauera humireducens]AMO36711.1 hypothetical protein AC731_007010 [Thauera humireducens]